MKSRKKCSCRSITRTNWYTSDNRIDLVQLLLGQSVLGEVLMPDDLSHFVVERDVLVEASLLR